MAANNNISVSDLDQAIDLTIAESDRLRVSALTALQEVLCAEAIPLVREKERLEVKFGVGHPRVAMIAELIEINQGFALEAKQEVVRAQLPVVSVSSTNWATHGLVKNMAGDGLPNLTVALYNGPTAAANWVQEFGYACTDAFGYFKLEASNPTATKGFLQVRNATATLYLSDAPLMPQGGAVSYNELVITGESLGCTPPPPAPPDIDLSLTKADSPDPVTPNADLTYTLTVTNHSQAEAKDVKVIDTLPAQTTFVSASVGGFTRTHSNGIVTCTAPSLAAGATATITIVVKVSQDVTHGTVLTNTAKVTTATSDADTTNDTAVTTTTVASAADLSITMTDTPDPVVAGQNITYTLHVNNPVGALVAQSVTVTDPVPPNTTFVSAAVTSGPPWTPPTTPVGGTGNVVFSKGLMGAGESATLQIVVNVNQNTAASTITNTAKVASTTSDPNAANNTATVTTNVIASSADLSINKTDTPDPVAPGDTITYTLTLKNDGPNVAENVTVTDTIPADTALVSATVTSGQGWPATPQVDNAGNVVFSKASFAAGETATFQIVVRVNPNTTATTISNKASVTSPTIDSNAAKHSATTTTTVVRRAQWTALVVFAEVNIVVISIGGDHTPIKGSTKTRVTFTDNVPNSGDLEAAFNNPPVKLKLFKGITMAAVAGQLDDGIKDRLNAVVSVLQKAGGASTLRTNTVVLSDNDRATLASSIADIDEVIFLELGA